MRYERPAIERRVELSSPVIMGAPVSPGLGLSLKWKRPRPTANPSAPPTEQRPQ